MAGYTKLTATVILMSLGTINSYLGLLKHGNTYKLVKRIG